MLDCYHSEETKGLNTERFNTYKCPMMKGEKRMKKRIVSLMLVAAMVAGMTTGCGGGAKENAKSEGEESGKTELTIMFAGGDQSWKKAVETVADKFMESNDDIELKLEPSGSGVYDDFLKTKEAVGEFGDVVELRNTKIYAQSGKVIELPESITSKIETPIVVDDKIYGVPTVVNTQGIIYNKKIFDDLKLKEPETYSDFLDICQKIKDSGVDPLVVGASDLWHMGFWVNGFFRNDVVNTNPDFLKQRTEGKVSWTDAEPTKLMEDMKGLFDKGYVQDGFMSTADSQTAAILTSGTAAMLFSGPWMFAQLEEADPNYEYGFFFLPNEDGELNVFSDNGAGWSISEECAADEKKYEAAQKFLDFFYSKDVYTEAVQTMNAIPATKEPITYEASDVQENLIAKFQEENTKKWTHQIGDIDTPDGFRDFMYKTIQNVVLGETTVEKAMEDLDAEWDKDVAAEAQ